MAEPLADLLTITTREEEVQALLSVLGDPDFHFPVTDYVLGAAGRTMIEAEASGLANHSLLTARIAAGGHAKLAAAMVDAQGNEIRGWLTVVADSFYDVRRAGATFTKQRLTFSCASGSGPQTVSAGAVARNPTNGNRYLYAGADVVIPDGGDATADFDAEFAGSTHNDSANTITELVTSLAGVTVVNSPATFGGVDVNGAALRGGSNAGTGLITPSGAPILTRQYLVKILAAGSAGVDGVVEIKIVRNGATATTPLSPIPATYNAGDGVTLAFDDGAGAGWILGDMHTFQTPGSPILYQGQDEEGNAALLARCLGRWPSLSKNIVSEKYVAWVRQASVDGGFGIDRISVRPSADIAGEADVVVATASGAPSGGVISALQSYLDVRHGITDGVTVVGATNAGAGIQGKVTVRIADLVKAQAAADLAWARYVAGLDIGGDKLTGYPGVVRLAALERALSDAGVIDVQRTGAGRLAFTANTSPDNGLTNLELGALDAAVVLSGQEPSNALTWLTVL